MSSLDRCELSWPRLKRQSDLLESEDEKLDDEELDDEDNLDLGIARLGAPTEWSTTFLLDISSCMKRWLYISVIARVQHQFYGRRHSYLNILENSNI